MNWLIIPLLIIILLNQFVMMCDINDIKDDINYIIFKLPNRRKRDESKRSS